MFCALAQIVQMPHRAKVAEVKATDLMLTLRQVKKIARDDMIDAPLTCLVAVIRPRHIW